VLKSTKKIISFWETASIKKNISFSDFSATIDRRVDAIATRRRPFDEIDENEVGTDSKIEIGAGQNCQLVPL
jgi:hypothetical protein